MRARLIGAVAALLTIIAAVAVIGLPAGTAAQDETRVSFEVTWGVDAPDCERTLPGGPSPDEERPAYFTGFLEVLTIRAADGEILHMEPLSGERVEDGGRSYCRVEVGPAYVSGPGLTVWHEDTYLASISPAGLGENALIILAD